MTVMSSAIFLSCRWRQRALRNHVVAVRRHGTRRPPTARRASRRNRRPTSTGGGNTLAGRRRTLLVIAGRRQFGLRSDQSHDDVIVDRRTGSGVSAVGQARRRSVVESSAAQSQSTATRTAAFEAVGYSVDVRNSAGRPKRRRAELDLLPIDNGNNDDDETRRRALRSPVRPSSVDRDARTSPEPSASRSTSAVRRRPVPVGQSRLSRLVRAFQVLELRRHRRRRRWRVRRPTAVWNDGNAQPVDNVFAGLAERQRSSACDEYVTGVRSKSSERRWRHLRRRR